MRNIITEERLKICREDRNTMHQKHFEKVHEAYGDDVVCELRKLYDLYDEDNYIWRAGLWDPGIGGFYFSEGGRDAEGFLPDIESTVQALRHLESSGLNSSRKGNSIPAATSDKMREKLVFFAKSLQNSEDGYFYHPHWGKRISTSRRGRDLAWSLSLLREFSEKPLYPTPLERGKVKNAPSTLPEHLSSLSAFREYLDKCDFTTRSYWFGNQLDSQKSQIQAAGEEFVEAMFSHLEERQRADNGLWEPQVNYASVNGLMKVNLLYTYFSRPLPNAVAAFNSAFFAAMSDEPIDFCTQFYNPLITMQEILENIKKFASVELADSLRSIIKQNAARLISITTAKVAPCKKADGGFGYFYNRGCVISQSAPVGLEQLEGDINASGICSTGIVNPVCALLEIPRIPLFGIEDSKLFYELIENTEVKPKTVPKPEWFESKLV